MEFKLALLLVGAISMVPTPGCAQAPAMVDYSTLTSEVVDLLRLRLTWAVPSGTVTGYNISCGMDLCDSILAVPNAVNNQVSTVLQHRAVVNSSLQVFIAPVNGMQAADAGAGQVLPVATFDDARPIVRVTALTSTFFVLDWSLPQTATGSEITVNNMYGVVINALPSMSRTSPVVVDMATVDPFTGSVSISVTPAYSSPTFQVPSNVAGTLTLSIPLPDNVQPIQSVNADFNEGSNSMTTISWQAPPTTPEGYIVTYNVTNLVDSSLVTSNESVPVDATSFSISTCPYCEVVVNVYALYASDNRAQLLRTSRFTTRQTSPSAPRNVAVVRSGIRDLAVTWDPPSTPNGVIMNYFVSYTATGGSSRREEVGSASTMYTILNLQPNTQYTVVVTGFTAAADEGSQSDTRMQTTSFGVTPPSGVSVADLEVTFTLNSDDGPISRYIIVLSTSPPGNTSSRSTIPAYTVAAPDFYGTWAGSVSGSSASGPMTVTIGTDMITSGGGISYTDRSLESSTDYYVFIRAYSSLASSRYSDSAATSFRTGSGTNVVAIVVPIVIVYILLMVVLIVLGVLAYIYVGKAYKLRKRYNKRKQEAAKRQEAAAAMNLVNGEEGKDGSASPPPKAEGGEPNLEVEVTVEDEKMADPKAEGTDI